MIWYIWESTKSKNIYESLVMFPTNGWIMNHDTV